jgi:hypothetical protein
MEYWFSISERKRKRAYTNMEGLRTTLRGYLHECLPAKEVFFLSVVIWGWRHSCRGP